MLIIVVAIAGYAIYMWQMGDNGRSSINDLLQDIADLDDDYEEGLLSERRYARQRQKLLEELIDLWPQGNA